MDPDAWRLLRLDRDAPRAPRPDLSGSGSPAFVGRVTTTGTTAANHYVKVNPVLITGSETEGGSGTLTVDTSTTVLVLFLGPGTTTVGDDLVIRWGDYRWVAQKKASGCPTLTSRVIHVVSCVQNRVGQTVNLILSGSTVATGTTNASGLVTFSGLSAATYTADAPNARLSSTSATFVVTCGTTTPQINILANLATGYHCLQGAGCADPAPDTLYLTDPVMGGPAALAYDNTQNGWVGCQEATLTNVTDASCASPTSRTFAVKYLLNQTNSQLTVRVPSTCTSGGTLFLKTSTCAAFPAAGLFTDSTVAGTTTACLPRGLTFTFAGSSLAPWAQVYGTGSRTFTISE